MKHIKNVSLETFRGNVLRVPKRDVDMEIVWEDKERRVLAQENATVARILRELIFQIPGELLTGQDSVHGGRLYNQILLVLSEEDDGYLDIEEAEWAWAIRKLEDDKIGPKLLHMSHDTVMRQLKELASESRMDTQAQTKAMKRQKKAIHPSTNHTNEDEVERERVSQNGKI